MLTVKGAIKVNFGYWNSTAPRVSLETYFRAAYSRIHFLVAVSVNSAAKGTMLYGTRGKVTGSTNRQHGATLNAAAFY